MIPLTAIKNLRDLRIAEAQELRAGDLTRFGQSETTFLILATSTWSADGRSYTTLKLMFGDVPPAEWTVPGDSTCHIFRRDDED